MPTELQQKRTQLSRAVVGNLLLFPQLTFEAISDRLSPEVLTPPERRLFLGARAAFESNGRSDEQIEPGSIILEGKLDPQLYTDCLDLASCVPDAVRQVNELSRIHQESLIHHLGDQIKDASGDELESLLEEFREVAGASPTGQSSTIRSLAEIISDPESQELPKVVAGHLAWKGRTVLLAAREKSGKSTLLSAAGAAVSTGSEFLGDPTTEGIVLYLGLEESPFDIARRFQNFGADGLKVFLLDRVQSPLIDLRNAIGLTDPDLTIIDTLPALAESLGLDPSNSTQWTSLVLGIARLSREFNTAIVLLHHSAKSGGGYRDSSAIGASVDVLIEMEAGRIPNTRKLKTRGRWHQEQINLELIEDGGKPRYELAQGGVSVDTLVLTFIEENPGCSTREIREGLEGQNQQIDAARFRLLKEGLIENRGTSSRHSYFRAGDGACPGQGTLFEDTVPDVPPHEHAIEHGNGHAESDSVPPLPPPIGGHGARSSQPQQGEDDDLPF